MLPGGRRDHRSAEPSSAPCPATVWDRSRLPSRARRRAARCLPRRWEGCRTAWRRSCARHCYARALARRLLRGGRLATTVNLLAADNKTSERFLPTRAVFIGPNRRRIVRFMRDQSILVRNGHAVAFNGGGSAARRRLSGSIVGNSPSPVLTTEQRVIRAYMTLFVIPAGDGGSKIVSLARFGPYEVRLCEPPHDIAVETLPLWIELYAHDRRAVLD